MDQTNTPDEPTDGIAQAFEALRSEVSLTRAAVEGLTAARERLPDYSLTLAEIAGSLKAASAGIDRIEKSPVARLSPVSFAAEVNKAATDARAEDRGILQEYRDAMSRAIGRVDGIIKRGQATDMQLRRLVWSCAGSFSAGIFLWSFVPGAIARSLPANWHVPEWMAARTMGMDEQRAGARLMELSAPPVSTDGSLDSRGITRRGQGARHER